jgi:intergrase/recombinase
MPKRPRRSRRTQQRAQKDKATKPNWVEWLKSELKLAVREHFRVVLAWLFTTVMLAAMPQSVVDSIRGTSPDAVKTQYYQV